MPRITHYKMNAKSRIFCLLILSLNGCSLIWQTVKIEVPKGYVGWVYVIPAKDTSGLKIQKHSGRYKINREGVAYVPTQNLSIKKDSRVLVYEDNEDISDDMRYAGSVYRVKNDGKTYEYIHFYLPSFEERKIADATQYWRDKHWEYSSLEEPRFDSLLQIGKLIFK